MSVLHCLTPLFLGNPPFMAMPEESIDDPETGIRCHYSHPNEEEICNEVLAYAQASWEAQVNQIGWPAPQPDDGAGGTDGLDIFLDTNANYSAWTASDYRDVDPDDGRRGSSAYIVLDPRLASDVMHLYVAHEFNHVLQFGMDFTEPSLPPWEAASTLAEGDTYPSEGSWLQSAGDYLLTPWESLLGDGWHLWEEFEIWSYYEYGAAFWLQHLRNAYGVEPVDYWWAMVNDTMINEPDAWDAYDTVTGDGQEAFVDLLVVQAKAGTSDAPEWLQGLHETVAIQGEISAAETVVTPEDAPFDLGAAYFNVTAEGEFTVELAGDPETRWLTVWIEQERVLDPGESFTGPATLAIASLGPDGFDPDLYCLGGQCRFAQRDLTVELLDAEQDPKSSEEVSLTACACAQRTGVPPYWGAWIALLVGWTRRARHRATITA